VKPGVRRGRQTPSHDIVQPTRAPLTLASAALALAAVGGCQHDAAPTGSVRQTTVGLALNLPYGQLTDLGVLDATAHTRADAINDAGDVAGTQWTATGSKAWRYTAQTGRLEAITAAPGDTAYTGWEALGIGGGGIVVGTTGWHGEGFRATPGQAAAIVTDRHGYASANGINRFSQIALNEPAYVGTAYQGYFSGARRDLDGSKHPIGQMRGTPTPTSPTVGGGTFSGSSGVLGIDPGSTDLVGYAGMNEPDRTFAGSGFTFNIGWGMREAYRFTDPYTGAADRHNLNDYAAANGWQLLYEAKATNGTFIVGWGARNNRCHAFRYTIATNGVIDLDAQNVLSITHPGGDLCGYGEPGHFNYHYATGINGANEIVGNVAYGGAFYYSDATRMVDLQTLIDPALGVTIGTAAAINDHHEIVGSMTVGSSTVSHAYKLKLPGLVDCAIADIDDRNPCTADSCSAATGVVHTPLAGTCLASGGCDLQRDRNNCRVCGNVCPAGNACVAGVCTVPNSCQPAGALAVLVNASGVNAYVPNGSWSQTTTGVRRVPIEGTAARANIGTPSPVNSCASNSMTGQTVCAANGTDVYVISGTTVSRTLTTGATAVQQFPGGTCRNCGVAIDAFHNRAAVAIGLSGRSRAGFQFLDVGTGALSPPISADGYLTSEQILIDGARNLLLSASVLNGYQLVDAASSSVFRLSPTSVLNGPGVMDAGAEDCETGIALASMRGSSQVFLADLTQASFDGSLLSTSTNLQTVPELASFARTSGIAVAPGTSHLGAVAGRSNSVGLVAFRLPASAGGVPALVDWAAAPLPNDPRGRAWSLASEPHLLTAYARPGTGRAFAVMANDARTFLAVVDLQALLEAPRQSGSHNLSSGVNLITSGILSFVSIQ